MSRLFAEAAKTLISKTKEYKSCERSAKITAEVGAM